ncbi:hypothetical protein [Kribbella shirazensis]|uniref:Uncharacterized protein n=1 Tax=Kribbella shirazensis TaxID=1105143 RepID=A0A7X5V5H7_9ACTN|nr:hypothetical protein [Kribbella shirazensis]NIK54999.1 hypothetical protein [Kribbella shirazensis]
MFRRLTASAGGAVLTLVLGALVPGNAQAAGAATAEACDVWLGSVTAAGAHRSTDVFATTPPTVQDRQWGGVYTPGLIRLSARQTHEPTPGGVQRSRYVVAGDALYWSVYRTDTNGQLVEPAELRRIGGGWSAFKLLEVSEYQALYPGKVHRQAAYALRNDGLLFRWTIDNGTWRAAGSYAGYAAVKSMALIAKTPTYDTFLANTRGGALYTIRIPVGSAKPVVTPVRTRTWQGFETLSAMGCGRNSTLLLGIDKDTKTAYLYAVGHANGLSTLIQSRGKVPGAFEDPVYFRWAPLPEFDVANGD